MIKRTMLAAVLAAAMPATAFAQGDDTGGGGGGDTGTAGGTAGTAGTTAGATAGGQMEATGSGPAIFKHGTMGLGFPISLFTLDLGTVTGSTTPAVHPIDLLWFNDNANAYDLILGVNLAVTSDHPNPADPTMTIPGATTFGFAAGFGYRMYKHHSERIHTYLEPRAIVTVGDVSSFADVLQLDVGAAMGVEAMMTEWFSVSGQVGLDATFGNKFKDINVGTFTGGLAANFYWQ